MSDFRIVAAGDAAWLVEWPARIDPASTRAVRSPTCQASPWRCPGRRRGLLFGDGSTSIRFRSTAATSKQSCAAGSDDPVAADTAETQEISVGVCYGGELGPDLRTWPLPVDRKGGHRPSTARHLSRVLVGIRSRFPLYGEVDDRLAMPRRSTPRLRVPAGSVAIAAGQTGIYPRETPGGWHLIGRTRLKPFDSSRGRILSCSNPETGFDFIPSIAPSLIGCRDGFGVIRPGMLTTVQDLGRWGHQDWGVPVAGPMDWFSHRLANEIVGNSADAAALEITLMGPELEASEETTCIVQGARFEAQ